MSAGHCAIVLIYPATATPPNGGPPTSFGEPTYLSLNEPNQSWPFVTSVTIVNSLESAPSIEVQLEMDVDFGERFLGTNLLNMLNKIEVQLFWMSPEIASPKFTGFMQAPDVSIDADGVSVTLRAAGTGVVGVQTSTIRKTYEGMSPRQILEETAKLVGFDRVEYLLGDVGPSKLDRTLGADDQFYVNTAPSLYEFMALVASDCGCKLIHVVDTSNEANVQILRVAERSALLNAPSKRSFHRMVGEDYRIDGPSPGEVAHFITGAFKPEGSITWAPGTAKPPQYALIDPRTKKEVSDKTNPIQSTLPRLGGNARDVESLDERNAREARTADTVTSGRYVPTGGKGADRTESMLAERQFDGSAGIKASWSCDGIPDLMVGEIAPVNGVGARFEVESGYMILGFTHSMAAESWTTSITGVSNGIPRFLTEGTEAPVTSNSTPGASATPTPVEEHP